MSAVYLPLKRIFPLVWLLLDRITFGVLRLRTKYSASAGERKFFFVPVHSSEKKICKKFQWLCILKRIFFNNMDEDNKDCADKIETSSFEKLGTLLLHGWPYMVIWICTANDLIVQMNDLFWIVELKKKIDCKPRKKPERPV